VSASLITLTRLDPEGADRESLIAFLTHHEFPFHVVRRPTRGQVERWIEEGAFRDDDNDSYWVNHGELGCIGFFRLEDLSDQAPVFDLRLAEPFRGCGLAAPVLTTATDLVFRTMLDVNRFEGQTREDNIAMRKVFLRCGWLKEAHYREGWPVEGAAPVASVAYGILRRDWETGETAPFVWEDLA
jgi:RimJ/RimL family protein N-acetyltransferase